MVVRSVEVIQDDNIVGTTVEVTSGVTTVKNVKQVTSVEKVTEGAQVLYGSNLVLNAIVSAVEPVAPYEGQVWIKVTE